MILVAAYCCLPWKAHRWLIIKIQDSNPTHHSFGIFVQVFESCTSNEIPFRICFCIGMEVWRRVTGLETPFGSFNVKSVDGTFWTNRYVKYWISLFAFVFTFDSVKVSNMGFLFWIIIREVEFSILTRVLNRHATRLCLQDALWEVIPKNPIISVGSHSLISEVSLVDAQGFGPHQCHPKEIASKYGTRALSKVEAL